MSEQNRVLEQDALIKYFSKTRARGWDVPECCFPKEIKGEFFPKKEDIFKAFTLVSPAEVKYVILGQDPYSSLVKGTDRPCATGIPFAIPPGSPLQPSLRKIRDSFWSDLNDSDQIVERYLRWITDNQILMLNAALTVQRGQPGSHLHKWNNFLMHIINQVAIADSARRVEFVAFGAKPRDLLCKALKPFQRDQSVVFAWHPQARDGGKSFRQFWDTTDVGARLKRLASFCA